MIYSWKSSFVPSWLWRRLQLERAVKWKYTLLICLWLCLFIWFRLLCVILVFSNKGQRYLRVRLAVPLFGSVACLRRIVADEGKLSPDQVNKAALCIPKGKSKGVQSVCGSHSKTSFQKPLHNSLGSSGLARTARNLLTISCTGWSFGQSFNVDFPHMPVEVLIKSSSILVFQSSTVLSCSIPSRWPQEAPPPSCTNPCLFYQEVWSLGGF